MIAELVRSFDQTVVYIQQQVADISDEEMIMQPPGAPNNAAWTLGHLTHSCQAIAGELGVSPWLPAGWESRFAYGSRPETITSSPWSNKHVLLSALADATQRLRRALRATDEELLAGPFPEEASRAMFPTLGDAMVQILCAHAAYHAGQLAAWRRTIGREPIGVFI